MRLSSSSSSALVQHFATITTASIMAFPMRSHFRLTSSLGAASKQIFKSAAPVRTFHSTPKATANFFSSRTATIANTSRTGTIAKARNAFRQQTRTYLQQPAAPANDNASLMQKLLVAGAMVGGTLVVTNLIFNRETREDGGMPPFEREYLNSTFAHTGLGVGIIGITARAMFQSGAMYRMMATNPWVVMIGGLGLSIGSMIATRSISPDK
jgi:hypothetical protein